MYFANFDVQSGLVCSNFLVRVACVGRERHLEREVKEYVSNCESLLSLSEAGIRFSKTEFHLIALDAEAIEQGSSPYVEPDICPLMVSFPGMWTWRLKANHFLSLSLPRQHSVGKQNRQAIVKGREVIEQFDLPALE